MSRIKRSVRPDTQARNWKAAIPALGLAAGLLAGCAGAPPAASNASGAAQARAGTGATCKKPEFPAYDLAEGHAGRVTMAFLVTPEGTVVDSKIEKSSGYAGLDKAAVTAIAKCKFKPVTEGGKPVQAWIPVMWVWTVE